MKFNIIILNNKKIVSQFLITSYETIDYKLKSDKRFAIVSYF